VLWQFCLLLLFVPQKQHLNDEAQLSTTTPTVTVSSNLPSSEWTCVYA